jgi:hypothetical protein
VPQAVSILFLLSNGLILIKNGKNKKEIDTFTWSRGASLIQATEIESVSQKI